MDMSTHSPVVILAPKNDDNKVLPIWIGHSEAWAIAMQLSGVKAKRPLTYDLFRSVIETLGAEVDRIEVTELREQTFYAVVHLSVDGDDLEVDARPSDSIALALKTGAAIFINDDLLTVGQAEESTGAEHEPPPMPTDPETLRERLKRINPEDFGKYSL
jgi:bifunctional DNase/RNase